MFSATRTRLRGTPTTAIALLALVLAMGGAAYAAKKAAKPLTKAQIIALIKANAVTGPEGKQGPAGTNGTDGKEGPEGKQGPKGDTGNNGTPGTSAKAISFTGNEHGCAEGGIEVKSAEPTTYVCNGEEGSPGNDGTSAEGTSFTGEKTVGSVTCKEGGVEVKSAKPATAVCNGKEGSPWTAGGTLPKGKAEYGEWTFSQFAKESEFVKTAISFPIPLEGQQCETSPSHFETQGICAEHVHFIGMNEGQGGSSESQAIKNHECTGTSKNPGAGSGNLCVFLTSAEKLEAAILIAFFGGNIVNAETQALGAGRSGALIEMSTTSGVGASGSHAGAEGTWVMRAPE